MLRWLGLASIVIASACTTRGSTVNLARGDAADPVGISRDCRRAPNDELRLQEVALEGGMLRVTVQHGGGCAQHTYAACWHGVIQETAPPRTPLVIHHDANGDNCDALLTREILIDLADLDFEVGAAAIADPAGTIELVGR
jgi:hypothetical protein